MAIPQRESNAVRFGLFSLDLESGELRKRGVSIALQDQPFRMLRMLIERRGGLVTREELRQELWPDTFVDFDTSLRAAVRRIRVALGDDGANSRFIETVPKQGYRFIAPVETIAAETPVNGASVSGPQSLPVSQPFLVSQPPKRWLWAAAAGLLIAAALGSGIWIREPSPVPAVHFLQLTHDGWPKTRLGSDGANLYTNEERSGRHVICRLPIQGGQPEPVSPEWVDFDIMDGYSAGGGLLAAPELDRMEDDRPMWILPLPHGSPRSLGLNGRRPAWSPDGKAIAYSAGSSLYTAANDGASPHKIASLPGTMANLAWSPDGRFLRFSMHPANQNGTEVWQISADGSGLRAVLPVDAELGIWTANRRYYLFPHGSGEFYEDLWAIRETPEGLPQGRQFALTSGPISVSSLVSGPGNRAYALGTQTSVQAASLDPATGAFRPFLEGVAADGLAFSRDGKWVAYTLIPERTLWRSRVDGSERLQLTAPPMKAFQPRWSPDGQTIAFISGHYFGKQGPWKLYQVPAGGGPARALLPGESDEASATWSAGGDSLAFAGVPWLKDWAPSSTSVRVLDLRNRQVSELPGSTGLWSPKWSPDGRQIVAETTSSNQLMVFDVAQAKWRPLATAPRMIGYPCWSHDSRYVYFNVVEPPAIYRVPASGGPLELVYDLKDVRLAVTLGTWFGLAPDDSLLVLRSLSSTEVYALDLTPLR